MSIHNPERLLAAATALLNRIDNISTEDFQRGGERTEREELRATLLEIAGISYGTASVAAGAAITSVFGV